jgi:hypothetical protein
MKKKQVKLEIPQEQAAFFAISSSSTIHKLSWEINSRLDINLHENTSICHLDIEFPTVKDDSASAESIILIAKNRMEVGVLIKELPNVDYVLRIQGDHGKRYIKKIIADIKSLDSVIAAIPIDPIKVKSLALMQGL